MASVVDICNWSLIRLGDARIQSLTEDSTEAKMCNRLYDEVRRSVLRTHAWGFATKIATLAQLSGETDPTYSYVYALPTGSLKALTISSTYTASQIAFEVRDNRVFTNVAEAKLQYVSDVTDPTLFDALFIEALTYRLAADLAMSLTRDAQLQQANFQMYEHVLRRAQAADSGERDVVVRLGSSIIDAASS